MDRKEFYSQYRGELATARRGSFEQFDKTVLSLSAGGLGLSLAFIKDIVPIDQVVVFPVLIWSWALFVASILSTLISFVLAQFSIDRQMEYAEEYYVNEKEEYFNKNNPFTKATRVANACAGSFFMVALVLTIVFVSVNISTIKEKHTMSEEEKSKEVPFLGGYVPPKMQKDLPKDTIIKGFVVSPMPKVPPPDKASDSGKGGDSTGKKE